jgi:hypothetical protein
MKVALCDLYKNPEQYAGKMVQVRATIVGHGDPALEEAVFTRQDPCGAYMSIALEFPQKVTPKPNFDLEKDSSFQKYEDAVQKGMRIEATLDGRFDPVFTWKDRKRVRVGEGAGYGKKHSADARLVLQKMSDVDTRYLPRK